MAIPSRQIGWGTEENLLWQISKQLERLTQVTGNSVSGSQTLAQTLVTGNNTGGNDILLNSTDAIQLENNSSLRKGTYDFGQGGGVSRICGVDYEDMWQGGIRHVFDSNGFIRNSTNCFNIIPNSSFDDTLRFKIGSFWTLDDGTTYECTNATTGAAVWQLYSTPPKYKVFTALLTQSGGNNPDTIPGNGGTLDAGYTYLIIDNPDNYDLTLYGAPNNLPGTYFICANSILNLPYTNSLQIGVNYGAPVATVLENTIGNVWFTYDGVGNYSVKSSNLFLENKTTLSINLMGDDVGTGYICLGYINTTESLGITTGTEIGGSQDNVLTWKTPIEIRVYN
jgi:hypothetical protein